MDRRRTRSGPRRWLAVLTGTALVSAGIVITAPPASAATTATFLAGRGILTVEGDAQDEVITLGQDADGRILVNGGAVAVAGGRPTAANTRLVRLRGQGGDDTLRVDEGPAPLPVVQLVGGPGTDTVQVDGGTAAENFTVSADAGAVRLDRVSPAPFTMAVDSSENLVVNAKEGDDALQAGAGVGALVRLTVDGGPGADILQGGDGADVLLGGDGADRVDGGDGDDVALLGAGNDSFAWHSGDDDDVIEGQGGADQLVFTSSNVSERAELSANGGRVRLFRDVANVSLDLDDVESLTYRALGGADETRVGDLSGTDLARLTVDLAGPNGTADGQADAVRVTGTAGADTIAVAGPATAPRITSSGRTLAVTAADGGTTDRLQVSGAGGDDTLDGSAAAAALDLDGGPGADVIRGGSGRDLVTGGDGDDQVRLGAGDDVAVWNPGDDDDTVDGQAGTDALLANGANISEQVQIDPVGDRVRLFRDVANVRLFLDGLEELTFRALGGPDEVVIGDLAGTDLARVTADVASASGGDDGQRDVVRLTGTAGDDVLTAGRSGDTTTVSGLAALVALARPGTGTGDEIRIRTGAGDDVVEGSGITAPTVLFAEGGPDDDVLVGGGGNDLLFGEDGDDVLLGNAGTDVLNGGAGDDIEIQ